MISSLEALTYHWLRSCWILHLWQQAQCNHTQLAPLHGHGWTRGKGGNRDIYWDTEENRYKVKSRVALLMKGCSCKSGCGTNRCGCWKSGEACGPGCQCINCKNTDKSQQREKVVERQNTEESQQTVMPNPISLAKLYNMHIVRTLVLPLPTFHCKFMVILCCNMHSGAQLPIDNMANIHTPVPRMGHRKMVYTDLKY